MSKRELHFKDAKSDKFWIIELAGDSYTISFGRSGTAGQTREKTFDSEDKAQAEYDKQIAAKLKKGYTDLAGLGEGAKPTPAPKKKAAAQKKPAPEKNQKAPSASTAGAPRSLQRTVTLKPMDRFVVTWEEHEPLQRPSAKPFDLDACIARLRKGAEGTYRFDWNRTRIPDPPSYEEAHFWIIVAAHSAEGGRVDLSSLIREIGRVKLDGTLSARHQEKALNSTYILDDRILACFAAMVSLEELIEIVQFEFENRFGGRQSFTGREFRRFVLPFLTAEEREAFRRELAKTIPDPKLPAGDFSYRYHLAAAVGCHAGVEKVVQNLPDGRLENTYGQYSDIWPSNEWVVFGLPTRERVIAEARRLKMSLCSRESTVAWLALTELDALDVISDSVCLMTNKAEATRLAKPISCVSAAEMAPHALRIATDSKAAQVGHEWLSEHPLEAAVGLIPIARGKDKLATAARDHLNLIRLTNADALEAACEQLSKDDAAWLRAEIIENEDAALDAIGFDHLPAPLREAFEAIKRSKLPAWLTPAALPPIKIGANRLADSEIETLFCALKATLPPQSSPLVEALKKHADPNSLDAFAWKLFETWATMGANSKEKWAMGAIGHLGGDHCVLKLTPLVRQWPGESQHQRAVFGLQCLRAINSETALMALNGIALKLKFKGLKERAKQAMEEIAKSRGMTRDELADRIVPDCGLDETGTREFDFGPRKFKFVLAGESKPMVRDEAGKVRANLPKPNKSDDPEKSAAALDEWKILKKLLRETLKIQSERFENAMITGRRWTPENFEKFIIKHPFMVNLARQLVFAAYDEKGTMVQTFRITEDQSIADQNDDDANLPNSGSIGIVHPAHLDEGTKSAWGEVLADYGIIPPFQQLGRTICTPEPDDLKKKEIKRFKGPQVPGIVMYGMLERSHWLRDTPADGGGFSQHSKYFESSDVTAFIAYAPGLSIGWYDEEQQLTSIYFVKGHVEPEMWGSHKNNRVAIGEVDAVVISEVLRLAHAIIGKAAG